MDTGYPQGMRNSIAWDRELVQYTKKPSNVVALQRFFYIHGILANHRVGPILPFEALISEADTWVLVALS